VDGQSELVTRLRERLRSEQAVVDLAAYFRDPADGTTSDDVFTGRHFQRLGGGGDSRKNRNRFVARDLIAVQMLGVTVPPEASVQILDGTLGGELADLLEQIPVQVVLGSEDAPPHVTPGSPADQAWQRLVGLDGIGWVTAGKLLARKRPGLIPVYDEVVWCALGKPTGFWLGLHEALSGSDLLETVAEHRTLARLPSHVSDLRVIDVVVWMSHRLEHRTEKKSSASDR